MSVTCITTVHSFRAASKLIWSPRGLNVSHKLVQRSNSCASAGAGLNFYNASLIPTQQRISLSAPSNSPIAKLAGRPGPQGHLTSHVRSAMGALVRSEWAPAFAHQETRLVLINMCRENRIPGRGSREFGPMWPTTQPGARRAAVLPH